MIFLDVFPRVRWICMVWFALISATAWSEGEKDRVLNFSAGWRVDSLLPENILQLGSLYSCGSGWCVDIEEFRGSLNISRQRLDRRHGMQADTGSRNCTDEYLTTISGARSIALTAKLQKTKTGYLLEAGRYQYVWILDPKNPSGLLLQGIEELSPEGMQYSQPVGFAYWSDDFRNIRFERSQYDAYFDGDIAHKNMRMGVGDDWQITRTSMDFRKFTADANDPQILGLTQSGMPEVLKRMKKQIKVHHSVLPPLDTMTGQLRFFNHEYGHDFNANGCFDEFGHNKLMLPVVQNNSIVAFVFAEYTHDKQDGVPMLSVGRYFRPKQW